MISLANIIVISGNKFEQTCHLITKITLCHELHHELSMNSHNKCEIMRIGKNFINNFQIPKYWWDLFKNKRPFGLMATLLIIDLSVQPDCHYCKLIYNSFDGTVPIFLCAMFERNETRETPRILAQFSIKRNYMYMNKV